MTCRGPYCARATDCQDTRCPGHPGQHCPDFRAVNQHTDDAFSGAVWILVAIVLCALWPILAWVLSKGA